MRLEFVALEVSRDQPPVSDGNAAIEGRHAQNLNAIAASSIFSRRSFGRIAICGGRDEFR